MPVGPPEVEGLILNEIAFSPSTSDLPRNPPAAKGRLVPVNSLRVGASPRLEGLDPLHVQTLAEAEGDLPPILVQRSTMSVIDGMHRWHAAQLNGDELILVRFFDGGEDEAFLLAVEANIRHGLPLSLSDRRAAAERIINSWPLASDRWIANITGLAAKTVASVRRGSEGSTPQPEARLGRDGRLRPVDSRERRRIASELISAHPDASLRTIARNAGISVGTARDVREKMVQGIDPVLPKRAHAGGDRVAVTGASRRPGEPVDLQPIVERLRQDPSLRYSEAGRQLLRWIGSPRLLEPDEWQSLIGQIPPHCTFDFARIARVCAQSWSDFADALDDSSTEACG